MDNLIRVAAQSSGGETRLLTLLDPYRYVLAADDALRDGKREDAVALIAQAYLAFDVLSADCL